jgi:hypothetical protein
VEDIKSLLRRGRASKRLGDPRGANNRCTGARGAMSPRPAPRVRGNVLRGLAHHGDLPSRSAVRDA